MPSGMYWEFGCRANGTEADAGTLYPTRLVDTNGNVIGIRYQGGLHYGGVNGSARISEIEDVRAVTVDGTVYRSYSMNYNTDPIPHLTQVLSHINDGQSFTLTYSTVTLSQPFLGGTGGYGQVQILNSMTVPGSGGLQFAMEYANGSREMSKVTMPYGGTIQWQYAEKTLLGSRTQMEVTRADRQRAGRFRQPGL